MTPPSLGRMRDLLSLAQVALAVLAVWIGTGGTPAVIAGAVALTVVAFVRPLPPQPTVLASRLWTALVFVALVGSVTRAVVQLQILDAGIDFLLLLCVQRFFNRQKTREHLQLQMLAAVLMILASVINTELSFPLILLVYLPLCIMGLLVNLLLAEGERLGERVQYELRRTGPAQRRLLWWSSLQVAAAATAAGLVVFFAFPRFGVGVFLRGALPDRAESGFSEQVRLGGFGVIKSDPTVVMRIVPDDGASLPPRVDWYLRGSAFDHYEAGTWSHGGEGEEVKLQRLLTHRIIEDARGPLARQPPRAFGRDPGVRLELVPIAGFGDSTESVRGTVILEDIGTDLVFLPSEPVAAQMTPRGPVESRYQLVGGVDRQISVRNRLPGPVQYSFLSRVGLPSAAELRAVGEPPVPEALRPYLQVDEALGAEFSALAEELTRDATTRYDKVIGVMRGLGTLNYTLDQPRATRVDAGDDPVEGFLFETRAGHCEYFATALALLLRQAGVPTRTVNGYYGAELNPVGNFYAVRQADAHSWVEVYFDELGWVTFDATPPSGRSAGQGTLRFPRLTQLVDAVRNAYLGYVIDYDLGKQFAALERLGLAARGQQQHQLPRPNWHGVLAWSGGIAALGGLLALLWWRSRRRARSRASAIYLRVLASLERQGFPRHAHESASRWAARVRDAGHPHGDALLRFARRYEAARFGAPADTDPRDELEALAAAARPLLRRPSARSAPT